MTREEAIRWLEDIHRRFNPTGENLENEGGDVHLQALDMAIEALSADAVQGWIPCSERLPSDDEDVIVSVLEDHGDRPWKYTTVAWLCNGVWISDNEILFGTAVAWMPLPKPYKGGNE